MFCGNCGASIPEGNHFCAQCGTPVSKFPAPAAAFPPPPPGAAPGSFPPQAAPPPPAPPPSFAPPPPPFAPPPPPQPPPAWQARPAPPYAQGAYPPASHAPQPYASSPAAGFPDPPSLHWALVLILAMFSGGLFGFIWFCIQAGYVKRIDPSSKARMLIVLAVLGSLLQVAVVFGGVAAGDMVAAPLIGMVISLASAVLGIAAVFSMRSSLVTHFNTAEPVGLRLSGVMTFFFSILYFQYHLSRIAEWRRTGALR